MGKVLVIDDEKDFVDGIVADLRNAGFNATGASSVKEIIGSIRKADYEIVLLDIIISDLAAKHAFGGKEAMTQIMTYCPDAKVVLFSSRATIRQVVECLKMGAIDFIEKPIGDEAVRNLVDRLNARLKGPNLVHDRNALRESLIASLWENLENGKAPEKGVRLEQLVYHIFASISGFREIRLRKRAANGIDEFDLEIRNERQELFWIRRGDKILVECKNLRKGRRASKNDLGIFVNKLAGTRGECTLGYFVSPSGFAKTFAKSLVNIPLGLKIVCIDQERLEGLVRSKRDIRPTLLMEYYEDPLSQGSV